MTGISITHRLRSSSFRYFATNAPLAMLTTMLPGALNYLIILYLVYYHGFASAGAFRLVLSVYAIIGLISLFETHKIFIRYFVAGDHTALTAIFRQRIFVSMAICLIALLFYLFPSAVGVRFIPASVFWISVLAAIIYGFDYHVPLLQAQKRFVLLFGLEFTKYCSALVCFFALLTSRNNVMAASLGLLAVVAGFHLLYFYILVAKTFDTALVRRDLIGPFSHKSAGEARTLSYANILPASLEHIDKILVGWVFGIEFLGIYVLAYSTGRILFNMLKPAFYIYYRKFVDQVPRDEVILRVGLGFTIIGGFMALVFYTGVQNLATLERFQNGHIVTIILFLSYGIGMSRALLGQALALNKGADPKLLLRASAAATCLALVILALALQSSTAIALLLLAIQYPVRDGFTILFLNRYRRRADG